MRSGEIAMDCIRKQSKGSQWMECMMLGGCCSSNPGQELIHGNSGENDSKGCKYKTML